MFAQEVKTDRIAVLLVEDSRKEALMTQRQLELVDDEFSFTRVSTLKEAMEKLREQRISVVVLDLGLPDAAGTHAVEAIHQKFPNMPIVVLSGQGDAVEAARALGDGAQEFMLKGECSGKMIRQAILAAIFRVSIKKEAQAAQAKNG